MFKKLRAAEEVKGIRFNDMKQSETVDEVLKSVETITQNELSKKTLKHLTVC